MAHEHQLLNFQEICKPVLNPVIKNYTNLARYGGASLYKLLISARKVSFPRLESSQPQGQETPMCPERSVGVYNRPRQDSIAGMGSFVLP